MSSESAMDHSGMRQRRNQTRVQEMRRTGLLCTDCASPLSKRLCSLSMEIVVGRLRLALSAQPHHAVACAGTKKHAKRCSLW